ncbi:MAG TPA: DUF4234 domain-containing protein, partial [Acidimicrobiales bacterium]
YGQMPHVPAITRLHAARHARTTTDYYCDFWTQLGWTILSCGFYSFYVHYRMIERLREHNRRRLELLGAANEIAWERAQQQGRADELRPWFERVAVDLSVMQRQTTEFREPWVWIALLFVGGGIVQFVLFFLFDGDLIKHSAAERSAEYHLTQILDTLGVHVGGPAAPPPKDPHQYALRIVATIFTCGIYGFWWLYDLMQDGNVHFARDAAFEDALVPALG